MARALFYLALAIFLIAYSAQKYLAVPQESFSLQYTYMTGLVILFTAILPLVLTGLISSRLKGLMAIAVAFFLPGILSAAGYASYWYLFITQIAPDVPIDAVVPRALTPGIAMGVILGAYKVWRLKQPA